MAKQYKCCSVSPFDVENNDKIPIIVDRFSVVPGQCQLGIPPHCLKGDKTMTNQPKADYNTPKEQLDKEQEKLYRLEQARSLEPAQLEAIPQIH